MSRVALRAIGVLFEAVIFFAVLLFVTAGTVAYWQAWLFMGVYFLSMAGIGIYLARKDPALLERRTRGGPGEEKGLVQKIAHAMLAISFLVLLALSALDHRFGWSSMTPYLVVAGDALVALGMYIFFRVFKENSYTLTTVAVEAGQPVISTGPYAWVRHPLYAGVLVLTVGAPFALGSWWGFVSVLPMAASIGVRLLDEERVLAMELAGYSEYQAKVKRHLVPFIW